MIKANETYNNFLLLPCECMHFTFYSFPEFLLFSCFLSFVGVYCITSHRDKVSEDTIDKKNGIMTGIDFI